MALGFFPSVFLFYMMIVYPDAERGSGYSEVGLDPRVVDTLTPQTGVAELHPQGLRYQPQHPEKLGGEVLQRPLRRQ